MADQNTNKSKISSGCLTGMPEMMRNMMSKKGGSCCFCDEAMTEMMQECCLNQAEKRSAAEEQGRDAPR